MKIEFDNGLVTYIDNLFISIPMEKALPITIWGSLTYNKISGYLEIASGPHKSKNLHNLIYYYVNGLDYSNKDMEVNHKNNIKLDNRITNLEI